MWPRWLKLHESLIKSPEYTDANMPECYVISTACCVAFTLALVYRVCFDQCVSRAEARLEPRFVA